MSWSLNELPRNFAITLNYFHFLLLREVIKLASRQGQYSFWLLHQTSFKRAPNRIDFDLQDPAKTFCKNFRRIIDRPVILRCNIKFFWRKRSARDCHLSHPNLCAAGLIRKQGFFTVISCRLGSWIHTNARNTMLEWLFTWSKKPLRRIKLKFEVYQKHARSSWLI